MKYRRLSLEELQELEKEFIHFLATNSIPAEDWERMKTTNVAKVEEMIDLFSDMVLEGALQNIKYLETRTNGSIMSFHFDKEEMELISIHSNKPELDLTKDDTIKLLSEEGNIKNGDFSLMKRAKPYLKTREEVVFSMTEQGCLVSDGSLHTVLAKISE